MSDVTIEFEDPDDVTLNATLTLDCVDYDWEMDRGITKFPIKTLKIFVEFFDALTGLRKLPPVLITDFGSTMEKFDLRIIIDEGSTDLTEQKAVELSHYIRDNSFMAKRTYMRIGAHIESKPLDLIYRPGKGREGKIGTVRFKWKGETYRYIEMTIPFHCGIELDVF